MSTSTSLLAVVYMPLHPTSRSQNYPLLARALSLGATTLIPASNLLHIDNVHFSDIFIYHRVLDMGRLRFQLDWLALRGVNLLLAWVGAEKILVEVFQEIGLTESDIGSFLSGPAFQAWNRFGNIQESWSPAISSLPTSWIESQLELQKKILVRMAGLGMTPVLPAFTALFHVPFC
jgi:hypothetical protein